MKNYSDNNINKGDVRELVHTSVEQASIDRDNEHGHLCKQVKLLSYLLGGTILYIVGFTIFVITNT